MALSKRLISALIAFSMSATIATTAFAQTDNSITLNEEQNQLQTVEPSQEEKLKIVLLRGHFLKKFRRCPLFAL